MFYDMYYVPRGADQGVECKMQGDERDAEYFDGAVLYTKGDEYTMSECVGVVRKLG